MPAPKLKTFVAELIHPEEIEKHRLIKGTTELQIFRYLCRDWRVSEATDDQLYELAAKGVNREDATVDVVVDKLPSNGEAQ